MRVMRARCNQNTVAAGCKHTDSFSCPTNSGDTASNPQPGGQKQPEQRKTQKRRDASCHFAAQEAEFGSPSRVGEEHFSHNRLASTVSAADRLPAFGPDPAALHPPPMKRAEIESKRREKKQQSRNSEGSFPGSRAEVWHGQTSTCARADNKEAPDSEFQTGRLLLLRRRTTLALIQAENTFPF